MKPFTACLLLVFCCNLSPAWDAPLIPEKECWIDILAPVGTQVTLNGRNYGLARNVKVGNMVPRKATWATLQLAFANGEVVERSLLLEGGKRLTVTQRDPRAQIPEVVLQVSHSANQFQISPDGTYLWCDGDIWDVATGMRLRHLTKRGLEPSFCPLGEIVACAEGDIVVYAFKTGQVIRSLKCGQAANSLHYHPDGKRIVAGYSDGSLRVWNVEAGKIEQTYEAGVKDNVSQVRYGQNGKLLAVAFFANDETITSNIEILDSATGKVVKTLSGGRFAFSPDGRFFASGHSIYEIETWRETPFQLDDPGSSVVTFSPDSRWLALEGCDQRAYLFDVATGKDVSASQEGANCCYVGLHTLSFSKDGQTFIKGPACGSGKMHRPEVWDAKTGNLLRSFGADTVSNPIQLADDGHSFYLKGRLMFEENQPANVFRVQHGGSPAYQADSLFEKFRLTKDKTTGTLLVHKAEEQKFGGPMFNYVEPPDNIIFRLGAKVGEFSYGISNDGLCYVMAGTTQVVTNGTDHVARVWDVANGKLLAAFPAEKDELIACAGEGSAGVIFAATKSTLRAWSLADKKEIGQFHWPAHFSPNSKSLSLLPVVGYPGVLLEAYGETVGWNYRTNEVFFKISEASPGSPGYQPSETSVHDVAQLPSHVKPEEPEEREIRFVDSPDGRFSVGETKDGRFGTWLNKEKGENSPYLGELVGAKEQYKYATFSPDSKYLQVSAWKGVKVWEFSEQGVTLKLAHPTAEHVQLASDDKILIRVQKTLELWDLRTGQRDKELTNQAVEGFHFPDRDLAAYLTESGTIVAWKLSTGHQLFTTTDVPQVSQTTNSSFSFANYSLQIDFIRWHEAELMVVGNRVEQCLINPATGKALLRRDRVPISSWKLSSAGDLVSCENDFYDLHTGEKLLSMYAIGENDWLAVTPEGLFDGTEAGARSLYYRIGDGLNVVPVERFYQDFHRAGLVSRILAGERPLPEREIGQQLPPKIRIVSPAEGLVTSQEEITLLVEVEDQGGGIDGPRVRRNGVPQQAAGESRREGKLLRQSFTVSLEQGENTLRVEAASGGGSWASEDAVLHVKSTKNQVPPELYILSVGVSKYDSDSFRLDYADSDAKEISALFQDRGRKLYTKIHLHSLLNADGTKEKIKTACKEIVSAAQPQDTLLIYLAGHGKTIGQRFYFIPVDLKRKKALVEDDVRDQGMPMDQLLDQYLAGLKAGKRMMVIDACNSGSAATLIRQGGDRDAFQFQEAVERLARYQGVHILAAATANQSATEIKELKHGALTYTLLAALGGVSDGDLRDKPLRPQGADGVVGVLEWFNYANGQVPALTRKYKGFEQEVRIAGEGSSFPVLPIEN